MAWTQAVNTAATPTPTAMAPAPAPAPVSSTPKASPIDSPCPHCRAGLRLQIVEGIAFHNDALEAPYTCLADAHTLAVVTRVKAVIAGTEKPKTPNSMANGWPNASATDSVDAPAPTTVNKWTNKIGGN